MVQRIVRPLAIGFFVVLLTLLVAFPIMAIVVDAGGAGSFEVGLGSLLLYRFVREGAGLSSQLLPAGLLAFALLGGLLNLGLSMMLRRAVRE